MTKNYFFARVFTARLFPSERRGTQVADFCRGISKEIFPIVRMMFFPKMLEKFLWNILYKNRQLVHPYL